MNTTPRKTNRVRNTAIAAAVIGGSLVGPAFVAPAINASPAAQTVGITVPSASAEAATAPDCNRGGIPIKWGKCYGPTIMWERGETFSYYGKSYTRYYEKARAFYSGVPGFIERTGDTRAQPTSWAAPRP